MKLFTFLLVIGFTHPCNAQEKKWSGNEKQYYKTTLELCRFIDDGKYDVSKRNELFNKYIYFINPKNDTSQNRLVYFDMLFYKFLNVVDSIGLENLDVKPIRFFEHDSTLIKKYDRDLKFTEPNSLAYYDRRKPNKALGALLFDPDSHKLVSWIILKMDGYLFLTPNMY